MLKNKLKFGSSAALFLCSIVITNAAFIDTAYAYRDILFPVVGTATYSNDYSAIHNGTIHHATDILAKKGQKLVAAVSGTIVDVQYPKPNWGYSVSIKDDSGYRYTYIHMNDDRPGTNDGKGGAMGAYAADVKEGNRVTRGQLLGWVGDSGYSNGVSHLHFEMYLPNGSVTNPYFSLVHAKHISTPVTPGPLSNEILPYGQFAGGANIAAGNIDIDQDSEFVTGAGKGGGPHVKIYQQDNTVVKSFFAYASAFRGGVDVAMGDVDGDGIDEVITAAGPGGGPHVKVFKVDGTLLYSFFAFDSSWRYGLRVTAGDLNGDLKDEVIVTPGPGTAPKVKVFDLSSGTPTVTQEFLPYSVNFTSGIDIAAGDVSLATPFDELVTVAGQAGQVKIFQGDGTGAGSFYAYTDKNRSGLRISVGNMRTTTPTAEIATIASNGSPEIKMFNSIGSVLATRMFLEEWWVGGFDIGAGYEVARGVASTNRRVSVRVGID